ncbi:MAG: hypothetical protein K0B06_12925 [Brevefilum sp.]|nr:hypothetical protein [Brevefilum sp.]
MQIKIDTLSVSGLGPIAPIKWQFKDVNLIYGKNERGKTFIVEYILSSLFKNAPKTRALTDSGQINISGLATSSIRFDPKSRKKIEDYLFTEDKPVDLSRLLVVKAGQSKFSPKLEKGIDKSILKDYLSDQQILDTILAGIPANIQRSSWENEVLVPGLLSGDSKTYNNYLDQLESVDLLLAEVNEKYALGEIQQEKIELANLEQSIGALEKARRLLAYQKSQEIKRLNQTLARLPQEDLDDIKRIKTQLSGLEKQIHKDQDEIRTLEPQCQHYPWLETAINECEKRPDALKKTSDLLLIILTTVAILAGIVFAFLNLPWVSLISGVLAVVFFVLAVFQYRSKLSNSEQIAEVEGIFETFEDSFGQKARSITDLKALEKSLSPKFFSLQRAREQLEEGQDERSALEQVLISKLGRFLEEQPALEDVESIIRELQTQRQALDDQLGKEEVELAKLGLEPDEYAGGPAMVPEKSPLPKFDPAMLKLYENQKAALSQSIQDKENALNNLKQRVCDATRMAITESWDQLIDALRNHRDEVCQSMKEIKAKIGAGVVITQVIGEIGEREDESITKALTAPELCQPIMALTHNYQGVDFEGDDIYVFSQFERYPLHNLSTGAQEQVLLALRIGIAAHFLKDKQMFLILDDAFQHSDWQRREWMVDQMADLASIGWQIIYFAMDDHIKQLFDERVKPKLQDRYAGFELKI